MAAACQLLTMVGLTPLNVRKLTDVHIAHRVLANSFPGTTGATSAVCDGVIHRPVSNNNHGAIS